MPKCLKLSGMCVSLSWRPTPYRHTDIRIIMLQGLDGKTALEVAKGPEVAEVLKKPEIATA